MRDGDLLDCHFQIFLKPMGLYSLTIALPWFMVDEDVLALDTTGIAARPIAFGHIETDKGNYTVIKLDVVSCRYCLPDLAVLCNIYKQTREEYSKFVFYLNEKIDYLYKTEGIEAEPQTLEFAYDVVEAVIYDYLSNRTKNRVNFFCNFGESHNLKTLTKKEKRGKICKVNEN